MHHNIMRSQYLIPLSRPENRQEQNVVSPIFLCSFTETRLANYKGHAWRCMRLLTWYSEVPFGNRLRLRPASSASAISCAMTELCFGYVPPALC